jgi:hypothetical protein
MPSQFATIEAVGKRREPVKPQTQKSTPVRGVNPGVARSAEQKTGPFDAGPPYDEAEHHDKAAVYKMLESPPAPEHFAYVEGEGSSKLLDTRLEALLEEKLKGKGLAAAKEVSASPLPLAVEPVIGRAIEVIGGRDEALRWLGTPVRALDYATPISLLGTSEGIARVHDVLGRMEHGVW